MMGRRKPCVQSGASRPRRAPDSDARIKGFAGVRRVAGGEEADEDVGGGERVVVVRGGGLGEERLEAGPLGRVAGEEEIGEGRPELGRLVGEEARGDVGVGVGDDPEVGVDLDGDALEDAEAADDRDVEGRQAKGEGVHDVAELLDDGLDVELAPGKFLLFTLKM